MKRDFFQKLLEKAAQKEEEKLAAEKRRNYFREIGRKGGLKKKETVKLEKVIAVRLTEKEYVTIQQNAEIHKLTISVYARLILTERELKVNEFKTDEILLEYGTNFKRISNLLRNAEWNVFENKKAILQEIEILLKAMSGYLYNQKPKDPR
ncbi:plasmid mobilization protein [Elizabethkingia anophelis]|uniref:plasmid mobilization protein n=1 Tax=Elizabethkingia anophelis TaxID=1117645 RepID=UPI0037870518